jgi:surface polysaccharide O-acyltransferase-like enzyme
VFYVLYSERPHWGEWLREDALQPFWLSLKHLLKGTGYVHLYFVLIVLQLYILYPLLRRWIERQLSSLLLVSLLITGLAQTLIYLHQLQILVLPGLWIPYVSLFPIWLFYFVFGMAAAARKSQWEARLQKRLLPLACCFLLSFALLLLDSRYTQTHASSIKPSVMLYTLSSFFFFYMIALRVKGLRGPIGTGLDWLSTHSFMVFLLHPLMLSLLVKHLPQLWLGSKGMILLFLSTTLGTVLVTFLLQFLPISTWLGGVVQTRKKSEETAISG